MPGEIASKERLCRVYVHIAAEAYGFIDDGPARSIVEFDSFDQGGTLGVESRIGEHPCGPHADEGLHERLALSRFV